MLNVQGLVSLLWYKTIFNRLGIGRAVFSYILYIFVAERKTVQTSSFPRGNSFPNSDMPMW